MAVGIFLVALASQRAKLVALPCGIMAVTSIVWMIVFNPSNRLDSLKPSTKKSVYRASFFCMIASFVGLIARWLWWQGTAVLVLSVWVTMKT